MKSSKSCTEEIAYILFSSWRVRLLCVNHKYFQNAIQWPRINISLAVTNFFSFERAILRPRRRILREFYWCVNCSYYDTVYVWHNTLLHLNGLNRVLRNKVLSDRLNYIIHWPAKGEVWLLVNTNKMFPLNYEFDCRTISLALIYLGNPYPIQFLTFY